MDGPLALEPWALADRAGEIRHQWSASGTVRTAPCRTFSAATNTPSATPGAEAAHSGFSRRAEPPRAGLGPDHRIERPLTDREGKAPTLGVNPPDAGVVGDAFQDQSMDQPYQERLAGLETVLNLHKGQLPFVAKADH
jgi:hypothetical protein